MVYKWNIRCNGSISNTIFYSVIAGWTLEYMVKAIGNQFAGKDVNQINAMFEGNLLAIL